MLKIGGVAIKDPSKFSVEIYDIDSENSKRNTAGNLIRDRVATKRKLICEWPPLTNAENSTLLTAVMPAFFTVYYPDPQSGSSITKTFYVGDRSSPMLRNISGTIMWEGLKMNFIEQ